MWSRRTLQSSDSVKCFNPSSGDAGNGRNSVLRCGLSSLCAGLGTLVFPSSVDLVHAFSWSTCLHTIPVQQYMLVL